MFPNEGKDVVCDLFEGWMGMGGIDGMVHEKIVTLLLLCAKQKTWGLEEVKRRVQGGLGTFDLVELGERWNGCEVDVGKKKEMQESMGQRAVCLSESDVDESY